MPYCSHQSVGSSDKTSDGKKNTYLFNFSIILDELLCLKMTPYRFPPLDDCKRV